MWMRLITEIFLNCIDSIPQSMEIWNDWIGADIIIKWIVKILFALAVF